MTKKVILDTMNAQKDEFTRLFSRSQVTDETPALSSSMWFPNLSLPRTKHEPIKVPPFSGQYHEWKTFEDIFTSLIDHDPHLSNCEKMHYLKMALVEDAKHVIDTLTISNDNYLRAWAMVKRRYDNKAAIVTSLVKNFISAPAISSPSANGVLQLQARLAGYIESLQSVGVVGPGMDCWAIQIAKVKYDTETQSQWAKEVGESLPTWEQFNKFVLARGKQLEHFDPIGQNSSTSSSHPTNPYSKNSKNNAVSLLSSDSPICKCCEKPSHKLFKCKKFLSFALPQRLSFVKTHGICENCLSNNHDKSVCTYTPCKFCNESHNCLLHGASHPIVGPNISASSNLSPPIASSSVPSITLPQSGASLRTTSESRAVHFTSEKMSNSRRVLLATAMVEVLDKEDNVHKIRAVFDSGSQVNIISTRVCQLLKLQLSPVNSIVEGIASIKQSATYQTVLTVLGSDQDSISVTCLVMECVAGNQPNFNASLLTLPIPTNLQLADPNWHETNSVDLLIGGEWFWSLLKDETHKLGEGNPILRNSVYGWLVCGPCNFQDTASLRVQSGLVSSERDVLCQTTNPIDTGSHLNRRFDETLEMKRKADEICSEPSDQWRLIHTMEHPTDVKSRGADLDQRITIHNQLFDSY
ncbi:DUF1758 domain-containing protein [Sergentomyia squamirostris]